MRPVSRSGTLAVSLAALAVFWLGCGGGGADLAGPALGSLDITTATSGPEPDADGYAVSIDDAAPEAIGTATTRRLEGLATGAHTVALSGVAANCTVASGSRQSVNVTANAVTAANFAVTCAPTTGAIQVTTSAGTPADPDGYQLLLDGVAALPIGTNASVTLPDLAPGSHAVGLGGLAADCRVDGDNPRTVPVVAGDTTAVGLAVSCTPAPPGAGTLEVTTRTDGTDQDADGYSFTLDGGPSQPIGLAATTSIANLPAGTHAVQLLGVAANCTLAGPAQQSVQVPGGGTAEVVFSITCDTRPALTGTLELTIAGLPDGTNAAVTVTGPGGYTQQLTATRTLADLQPGSYTVAAAEVTSGGARYTATPASRNVAITAGGTKQAMVTYAAVTTPSVNLRIDGWYLTQSTQSASGDIPLVTNRDAYLRVFVVSDGTNTAAPGVRVRLYRSGSLTRTLDIPSPAASTPTKRDEGRLASSWNVKIPRELITPGLAVVAEVDPDNAIPEKNEADNNYPASGTPQPQTVRDAPVFGITFVPIMQKANGLAGDVSDANRSTYLELSRRMHPLPGAEGSVHAVYTTTTEDPLEPDDANGAWSTVLSEINALRISEGTDHTYYGVVHIGYASGVAGLGYIGAPAAMGYDRDFDRSRVMAHELGHGRRPELSLLGRDHRGIRPRSAERDPQGPVVPRYHGLLRRPLDQRLHLPRNRGLPERCPGHGGGIRAGGALPAGVGPHRGRARRARTGIRAGDPAEPAENAWALHRGGSHRGRHAGLRALVRCRGSRGRSARRAPLRLCRADWRERGGPAREPASHRARRCRGRGPGAAASGRGSDP
jgi:hypothetical protein